MQEILQRAGRPMISPAADWALERLVTGLTYVPKNKPFLVGEPPMPQEAPTLLALWPDGEEMARWLLTELCPCHDPRYDGVGPSMGGCFGCKSADLKDFGRVYSSKTDVSGFVEGIVSSLANWKLYALGIAHDGWTEEFLLSHLEDHYAHPLRPQEQTTAGAVVHTQYCCLHMLAWHQCVLASEVPTRSARHRSAVMADRVRIGLPAVQRLDATPAGAELLEGMIMWAQQLLSKQ